MFWLKNERYCIFAEIDDARDNMEMYTYKYLLHYNEKTKEYSFERIDKEKYDVTYLTQRLEAKDIVSETPANVMVFYLDDAREFLEHMPVGTYELDYDPMEKEFEKITINDFIKKANLPSDSNAFMNGYKGFVRVGFAIKRICTVIEE